VFNIPLSASHLLTSKVTLQENKHFATVKIAVCDS
jgi:hypothetical protein